MIVQDVPAEVRPDPAALYDAAVADRRGGRHDRAVAALDQVLALRPGDADARLNRGLSLLALGRLDAAEADFEAVLAAEPGYVDARIGLARVAQRRGDREAARAEAALALAAAPDRADVRALMGDLDPASTRVDLDVSHSRLGAGLPDWTEARLGVTRSLDRGWIVGGAVEWTERFENQDVFVEARVERRFEGGGAYVAIGGAPEADYRPEASLRAGGDFAVSRAVSATLDASVSRFASGTVTSLQPGLSASLAGGRLGVSGRWIHVWDETDDHRTGYALGARWAATDRLRLRLDHADAPETSEGVTVDVRSWALGAEYDVTDRVSLRATVLDEDRGAYDRQAVSLGVGWRF